MQRYFHGTTKLMRLYFGQNRVFTCIWLLLLGVWVSINTLSSLTLFPTHEALVEMARQRIEARKHMKEICPQTKDLLLVSYECPEDVNLKFYTTEYLDKKPEHTDTVTAIFASIDEQEERGPHGMKPHCDVLLDHIPKDFDDPVDFELVHWIERLPGKTVEATGCPV